jgi:hypothetical protein
VFWVINSLTSDSGELLPLPADKPGNKKRNSTDRTLMETIKDVDPEETTEWLDALEALIDAEGIDRAHFLLENLIGRARSRGTFLPYNANTP